MLEITSTQGLLDHDTSRAVLIIWTAPSAPLIFYPQQFIWSSVCTHTVRFRKSFLLSPSVARCFCMACSDDSETEWRIEARQLRSNKRDPPGRGCESMSVGVGTCAMLLGYFKVPCPSPLSHWIHVTTPGCVKGFFKSPRPRVPPHPHAPPPSPTPTPTVWLMQTGIMADHGETKHSFSAVCDMKEGLHFFPLSLSPLFLFFLQSGLLWVAPWVDCMWRGDVLTTGSLLIAACVHQNTEKDWMAVVWVQLTKVPCIGSPSPFFFRQCCSALKTAC